MNDDFSRQLILITVDSYSVKAEYEYFICVRKYAVRCGRGIRGNRKSDGTLAGPPVNWIKSERCVVTFITLINTDANEQLASCWLHCAKRPILDKKKNNL